KEAALTGSVANGASAGRLYVADVVSGELGWAYFTYAEKKFGPKAVIWAVRLPVGAALPARHHTLIGTAGGTQARFAGRPPGRHRQASKASRRPAIRRACGHSGVVRELEMMRPHIGLWLALAALLAVGQPAPQPAPLMAIFVVDGLRPDSINAADTPTIERLR